MTAEYEPVEGELVDEGNGTPAPARSPDPPAGVTTGRELEARRGVLFKTDDPAEILVQATSVANQFKDLLRRQQMVKNIQGRDHVLVEGWQTVGVMLGLSAVVEWSRPYCDPVTGEPVMSDYEVVELNRKTGVEKRFRVRGFSWEARVVARRADGQVVAAGEALCSRNESTWATRADFALRSMAQTRASSKALRAVLGWIVTMAGYNATPSEEVDSQPEGSAVPASDELSKVMLAALTFLLHKPERVQAVQREIEKLAGGYMPAPAAQGIVLTAKAIKEMREEGAQDGSDD